MGKLSKGARFLEPALLLIDDLERPNKIAGHLCQGLARVQAGRVLALHPVLSPNHVHGPVERFDAPMPADAFGEPRRDGSALVGMARDEPASFVGGPPLVAIRVFRSKLTVKWL